jgi:hypothetical protein
VPTAGRCVAMKTHTFKVIQWLGLDQRHEVFAVVEVDKLGPVLRDGPYKTLKYANHRAAMLATSQQRRAPAGEKRK